MEIKKQSFIKGAAILAAAGLITKILGAIYRIPLGRIVGAESMGYYGTAYSVYTWALTISAYAIPIAISKLTAEKLELGRHDEAKRIFRVALTFISTVGLLFSIVLLVYAKDIANLLNNPGSYIAILCVVPSVFLFSVTGALRGYFQGMQNMMPSAVSQVFEQLGRVVFGFILAIMLLPLGYQQAAGGAVAGTTVGGIISIITLLFIYFKYKSNREGVRDTLNYKRESALSILKRLIVFTIPITIGSSVMPIMGLLDSMIIMDRLQAAGYSLNTAVSMYGQLTQMAMPFINLPQVLTISLAASLVPAISESVTRRDLVSVEKKSELAIRISLIMGLPAAFGLFILADPIMTIAYPTETSSVVTALMFLAPAVIFLTLVQTLTAILQGMGKEKIPVLNLAIGAFVKIIVTYTLTSIPSINVRGAAIGTVAAYAIASILNLRAVIKYQKKDFNYKQLFGKPILATVVMSLVAYFAYKYAFLFTDSKSLSALLSMLLAAIIYAVTLILTKGITTEELQMAPGGGRLSKVLKKKGLVK
ncbi:MAG: Polysaccharide biosynthesis protein [Clostridia bacterium]|jgi:stage V sporulation protein B|nr:Polysaccharide biosynthesis protein [Clostridia bacterium]